MVYIGASNLYFQKSTVSRSVMFVAGIPKRQMAQVVSANK
jgi:hypothetical protein